ncbi:hypothetical protein CSC12_3542 [Klebsiella michiganensis]|nr:hypothetical protein CSC12_3542 [Klebsiella michiganensis]
MSVSTFYTKKLKSNNFRFLVKKNPASAGFFVIKTTLPSTPLALANVYPLRQAEEHAEQ